MTAPAPTRPAFLAAYRTNIVASYAWAQDGEKLDRYMRAVETTINTDERLWTDAGKQAQKSWAEIGGTGKVSLKRLKALPTG